MAPTTSNDTYPYEVTDEEGFNTNTLADALDEAPETDYGGSLEPPQVWMCVHGEMFPVRYVAQVDDFEDAGGGDIVLYPETGQ